jgi:two-component system, sensor histidine kinase PdtaS
MADVARRVVRMLEGSLGREDAHIELHTASVRVDAAVATPLAVILNELIQNAVEHGLGEGHGTVTVELRGGDDHPVELVVHDDGTGSAGPAVSSPAGGLGLRLVRALVEEELAGQFTLTHAAGRGSIATATIPPVERAG